MTDNAAFLWAGLALLSGWVALVRFRASRFATFAVRGCLAAAILSTFVYVMLPNVTPAMIAPYFPLYLIMICGPVAGAAFVFSLFRRVVGSFVYLGALLAASVWFSAAFKRYVAG